MAKHDRTASGENNIVFATRLAEIMKNNETGINLSEAELADSLGYSKQTINNYLSGKTIPDIDVLKKISVLYNVPADYLIGLTSSYSTDKDRRYISDELGFSDDMINRILAFKDNENYGAFLKIVDVLLQDKIYLRIVNDLKNKTDEVSKAFDNRKKELKDIMTLLESKESLEVRTILNDQFFEELDKAYDDLIRNYSKINDSITSKEIEQFNLQMHLIRVIEKILGTSNREEYFEVRKIAESLDVRLTLLRGKAIKAFENQENLCKYSSEPPVSLSNPWRE